MGARILSLALAFHMAASAALAIDAAEMFDDPAQEARAREIGRGLRCLVCQNQSIFDSNAGLARDLRVVVRERIVAGDSDAEVLDFISERFGAYVLLAPPVTGQTAPLWLAPVGLLLAGVAGVAAYLRGRQRGGAPSQTLAAEDREAARRLLNGEEA